MNMQKEIKPIPVDENHILYLFHSHFSRLVIVLHKPENIRLHYCIEAVLWIWNKR